MTPPRSPHRPPTANHEWLRCASDRFVERDALRGRELADALLESCQVRARAPECRHLTGLDPESDAAIERHAELLARLLVP